MALLHEKAMRGRTNMGWLDSFHTFSFGGFSDPHRMGHRALRVINEDRVIGGAGFGTHEHANMDILTFVVSGSLRHEDSIGNGSVIVPGEIQMMSAGSGIRHSEMNASTSEPVHFLQIWIIPEAQDVAPRYAQLAYSHEATQSGFGLIAGPDSEVENLSAVPLHSGTRVYLANLQDDDTVEHAFVTGRHGFLQIIDGMVEIEGEKLSAGDGLQFSGQEVCTVKALSDAQVMLFDLV
ncbi:MAG: pirin family protein [Pseudomonadota bacterium]